MIPEHLIETSAYTGEGYKPLIDYGEWRVAVLRYHPELLPGNINKMHCHTETDEVFVLLDGHCVLFVADQELPEIHAVDMQPLQLYNIKRTIWHSHSLSHDATVLIVENRDTTSSNSPEVMLTEAQRAALVNLASQIAWTEGKAVF